MTTEEKTRFDKMEDNVFEIKKDVEEIKNALLGNKLSGEKGLSGRIDEINERIDALENEMKTHNEDKVKNGVYVKIITWLLVAIGTGVIGFFIDKIINR